MKALTFTMITLASISSTFAADPKLVCQTSYTAVSMTNPDDIGDDVAYLKLVKKAVVDCGKYYKSVKDSNAAQFLSSGAKVCTSHNQGNSSLAEAVCRVQVLNVLDKLDGLYIGD